MTVGAGAAVTSGSGGVTRRTPMPPDSHQSGSGWLSSSESISHGRFAPGALLDGRYRIVGMLGKGGMGEVYRADDLRLGQPVALKFLPEGLRTEPVRLAQFHNEVRTARQVSHANVCRVYDIGEANGLLYLSMEYVDGEDLASSLRRIGRFPEDKAIEIARQLCAGLAAAHQRGVIHRDLKPANVMLDGAGRVRIMDFGLAAVGAIEDVRVGTPAYMAPEQLLGREVTPRSDIFALGLVMYELFTGRRAFTAATMAELVEQHESRALAPPSTIVSTIDAAVERAILRCLDPDPERRPASALSISAALPGGDPLAAALAAGETPSPEMVAAAGEGAGLSRRTAALLLAAILVGLASTLAFALRTGPFDVMRPEYTPDVLAQKARDAVHLLGYPERPRDEAYGFRWDDQYLRHMQRQKPTRQQWSEVVSRRPSPLIFWYRQSPEPLTSVMFHTDLLTPGIVDTTDPPPIEPGMIHTEIDHAGRLTLFEAIPPQRDESAVRPAAVDWKPLFQLAALDQAQLQSVEPLWNWLAAADTRAAWTGVWPESGRPLRVEAAARGGRPVAFVVLGPWRTPWRTPDDAGGNVIVAAVALLTLAVAIVIGAGVLAHRNVVSGRGDRRGAARLAGCMTAVLIGLWICRVHLAASIGLFSAFLIAICTAVFYGVLLWTIYLALEPFVRRHWPQVLVSWTTALTGRPNDPVVGRDVLIGVALGVWVSLLFRVVALVFLRESTVAFPGSMEVLLGVRSTAGEVLEELPYAMRNVLLYFFVLFVLRVILRRQWAAAVAFTTLFAVLNALGNAQPAVGAVLGVLYFGTCAIAILRWGLLPLTMASFVTAVLFDVPATRDLSAWYSANSALLVAIVVALAGWGFYTAIGSGTGARATRVGVA